ncbi:MAG: hypothetical protein NDJ89_03340 [Oligoflexia bacterium]|nr:hypothetical protein [Oligoflexia bacterium]
MPFRSGKYSSKAFAKLVLTPGWALIGLGLLAAPCAQARFTLTAVRADETELGILASNSRAYFAAAGGAGTDFFLDSSDGSVPASPLDLTQIHDSDPGHSHLMRFKINSNKVVTPGAGEIAVLFVTTTGNVTTSPAARLVPIATVGSTDESCANTSQCLGETTLSVGSTFRFAVRYSQNADIYIGIYPRDVCRAYYADAAGSLVTGQTTYPIGTGGGSADGCTVSSGPAVIPDLMTASTSRPMQLSFWIGTMTEANYASLPALPTGTADAVLSIHFPTRPTAMSCPASPMTDVYFPGDSSILLNATAFANVNSSAFPPRTHLIVNANKGSDPPLDLTYGSSAIVQKVGFGGAELINGFENKTSNVDTTHDYNLGFMVRDQAGWVATTGSCYLRGVQTSPVLGLLNKSSCFIATGAFGSMEAEPVAMLRAFRDRMLLPNAPGRAFVQWYYRWSPRAGEWLMAHPEYRPPVLLLLTPLELLAWLFLNPGWLALWIFINIVGLVLLIRKEGWRAR